MPEGADASTEAPEVLTPPLRARCLPRSCGLRQSLTPGMPMRCGEQVAESAQREEHELETGWTFWVEKHPVKEGSSPESLRSLGSCRTVEAFWKLYTGLERTCDMEPTSHCYVFREGYMPMLETFPNGGAWHVKLEKEQQTSRPCAALGRCWEEVLMAAVGEQFEQPDLVGVVVSILRTHDSVQIWTRGNAESAGAQDIGTKLKTLVSSFPPTLEADASVNGTLNVAARSTIEFQENAAAVEAAAVPRAPKPFLAAVRCSSPQRECPCACVSACVSGCVRLSVFLWVAVKM